MSQISGDDRERALQIHNDARSALGSQPLVWDDDLGNQAAQWAQHLADIGQMEHNHDPTTPAQGENLYAESGTDPNTLGQQGAQCWINEKPNYHGENIGEGDFGSYGHYSKIYSSRGFTLYLSFSSPSCVADHHERWNWFCNWKEWVDLCGGSIQPTWQHYWWPSSRQLNFGKV